MKKKRELATLAMIGISAGLMVTGCQQVETPGGNGKGSADEQLSSDMQTFFNALSPETQRKFNQLDAQHKMMAIEMAQQQCNAKNSCEGMGGCAASPQHSCAGKNACKGQGGAPIKDPNKAVEVQYNNQMMQREKINSGMGSSRESAPQQNDSSHGSNH
jgi:hypothetical protein